MSADRIEAATAQVVRAAERVASLEQRIEAAALQSCRDSNAAASDLVTSAEHRAAMKVLVASVAVLHRERERAERERTAS